MRVLEELQEDVFRFRMQHRYDHRFMFFLFDLLWNLARLSLFAAFTYALWLAGIKVLDSLDLTFRPAPVTNVSSVENSALVAERTSAEVKIEPDTSSVSVELGNQSFVAAGDLQPLEKLAIDNEPSALAALPPERTVDLAGSTNLQNEAPVPPLPTATTAVVKEIPALAPPAVNRNAKVLDGDWIMGQAAKKFTIQIGSTPNRLFLRRLGSLLPGDHERAVYHYKNTPDGEPEYGLAWGVFDSVGAARTELAGLDDYSKRYGPWIRRVQGIQAQMEAR